ncbi:hypothetical protein BDZ85DRAFT_277629 [Elsinoe ampelina]|uniref:F-box domain-containing protein n=1 Tax=Elsinoe ampelina TaxID=302913 RepID=A0A6A6GQ01_9PEZI|nr:hypothetical protein BDZ85DRAFT_277629 [Elsinoe ampelina]
MASVHQKLEIAERRHKPASPQLESPLFGLPPELRRHIFDLVVSPTPSTKYRYPRSSIWNRPGHYVPIQRSSTLLRTCQRIYSEALPLLSQRTKLTFYITTFARRPAGALNPFKVQAWKPQKPVEVDLEVFAQLWDSGVDF